MANQKIDASQVAFTTGGVGVSLTVEEVDGVPTVVGVDTIVVSNGTLTDDGGGQVTITTGGGSNLTVEETDGAPTVTNVNTIKVTNGTLTDDGGGVVTLTTGGSTTPASPDKSVQYNNNGSFGAVTVNATGTAEYLKQVSSGTPAFAQVAYSEVSGTPTIPSAASSVTAETSYGASSNAGSAGTFSKGDHTHGTPSLSTNTPAVVAGTATAGSGTAPSKDDHAHVGVHSVAKSGSSALVGDVTLSEGTNVTLTQSGNNIAIAATGASGVTRSGATTDGHLAVWNGSSADSIKDGGAVPTASGALVLLEQHTGNNTGLTLDFTTAISSTYDEYMIEVVNLLPASNNVVLVMNFGTGGTPTWDTGNNYAYANFQVQSDGSTGARASAGTSSAEIANVLSNNSAAGCSATIKLFGPANGVKHPNWTSTETRYGTSYHLSSFGGGRYLSTTAITAVRFSFSAGNVYSGTIRMYGVAKS